MAQNDFVLVIPEHTLRRIKSIGTTLYYSSKVIW